MANVWGSGGVERRSVGKGDRPRDVREIRVGTTEPRNRTEKQTKAARG